MRHEIRKVSNSHMVNYKAPWNPKSDATPNLLDLFLAQATLEYVFPLEETYNAISKWLKPGGHCSHTINFSASYLSPFWNGQWAYSDWQWRLARGRREFFLNREPLSTHLDLSRKFGFDVLLLKKEPGTVGLRITDLSRRFRTLASEDLSTRGAMLVLRKQLNED